MPTRIPSQGRRAFGFGSVPYNSYFPQAYQPTPNVYDTGLAGYSPLEEIEAQQNADATMQMMAGDVNTPQGVTGLQRLVGSGYLKPQQATAIARLGKASQRNTTATQDALADLYTAQTPEEFNAVIAKHRDTGALADPHVQSAMNQAHRTIMTQAARPQKVAPVNRDIMKAYGVASSNPSDTEKSRYIKSILGIGTPANASSEDWKKAFNEVHASHLNTLKGLVTAAQAAGQQVPPEVLSLLQPQMPQNASQDMGATSLPQAAPNAATAAPVQQNGASGIVSVASPAEVRNLPKGTPFRTPDGQIRISK